MMQPRLPVVVAASLLVAGTVQAADAPPGAWSCTGCHVLSSPISGPPNPIPGLRGRPAVEVAGIMREFKSHARPATVMTRIASGFSDAEIDAIAEWLAQQGN